MAFDTNSVLKPTLFNKRAEDALVDKPISIWKKAFYVGRAHGLVAVLSLLAKIDNHEEMSYWQHFAQYLATFFLIVWKCMLEVYRAVFPFALVGFLDLLNHLSINYFFQSFISFFSYQMTNCVNCLVDHKIGPTA